MVEFGKAIQDLDKYLAASQNGFREGWRGFRNAEASYKMARQVRETMLLNILKEKGLAVCSIIHSDWKSKVIENPLAEQLGIYPRDQMRLHFYRMGPYHVQGEYEDSVCMTTVLHLLCPEHFPQNSKWTSRQDGEFSFIESEVVLQDGKFILAVDESDITRLVTKGGVDIEPDGKSPCFLDPAIYRYFDLPDLPQKPDLDKVKYSA